MTVIAWDGQTLAADKYAYVNGIVGRTTKIRKISGNLIGVSGPAIMLPTIFAWAETNFAPEVIPLLQKDQKEHAAIMLIKPSGEIWIYENDAVPWQNERPKWAIGIGREFAIGAMAARATAVEAIEIASEYGALCGGGIDTLTFDEDST